MGEDSGGRKDAEDSFKSRKGFGYRVRQAKARPSNTLVRHLLSDRRYTEAVLEFIGATRVGGVEGGRVCG